MSKAQWIKRDLARYEKRLKELKWRKSHAPHETQRELADLFYRVLDTTWRNPILWFKSRLLAVRMAKLHEECCDTEL